jgi:transposase
MAPTPSRDELAQLDKPALIELIVQLLDKIEQLEAQLPPPPKPLTTSANSSQPPSRDHKPQHRLPKDKAKHGPKTGHPGSSRQWCETPDQLAQQRVVACQGCGTDLAAQPQALERCHQLLELPPISAQVIEVQQYGLDCPHCGVHNLAPSPPGCDAEQAFGARLQSVIVYLKHTHHLSYERMEQVLQDVFGVTLSQGAIDNCLRRAGQAAEPAVAAIQEAVARSPVIHGDETGSRIDGGKAWHWVLVTLTAVLHLIRRSRGQDVPQAMMGKRRAEVWVCDCWSGQLNAPAETFQLCLAHQVRNLQAVIDAQGDARVWAAQMQAVFYNVMRLAQPQRRASLPSEEFAAEWRDLERQLDDLVAEELPKGPARTLQKRYRKHRQHLFVCLARRDVPATNNVAERALRPAVVHRNVTNGFRSQWGADAYAALLSITDTAKLHRRSPFLAILDLMGLPALPLSTP